MLTLFALFIVGSMASLALPEMSGFVGELSIFLGVQTSDAYSSIFKVVIVLLAAVGLILISNGSITILASQSSSERLS